MLRGYFPPSGSANLALDQIGKSLGEFLRALYARYNIVVGPEEVRVAFRIRAGSLPAPLADLKDNERRLEERLRVRGGTRGQVHTRPSPKH